LPNIAQLLAKFSKFSLKTRLDLYGKTVTAKGCFMNLCFSSKD
jgi:hypothetical protein